MFPFNQPESTKEKPSKDCGYRCLYYVLGLNGKMDRYSYGNSQEEVFPYETWLNQFRFFQPVASGITFTDIGIVLDYYNLDFRYTHLTESGLYIIYSGIWLHHEGKKHGHYFIYKDGVVYCSTHSEPYRMPLEEVLRRLEAKNIDHSYRVLKVLGEKSGDTGNQLQEA